LFEKAHAAEKKDNTNRDTEGHGHPNWIFINGKQSRASTSWLEVITIQLVSLITKSCADA
jgi:hypothetical protein